MMDLVNGFPPPWGGVGGPSPFPYPDQRRILTQPLGGHTFLLIIWALRTILWIQVQFSAVKEYGLFDNSQNV